MASLSTNPFHRAAVALLRSAGYFVSRPPELPSQWTFYVPTRTAAKARYVIMLDEDEVTYTAGPRQGKCNLDGWMRWISRTRARKAPHL